MIIDTVIDIMSKWIEIVQPKKDVQTIIIPTSSILLSKLEFHEYKNASPTNQKLLKEKTLALFERIFKGKGKYWYCQDAVFYPNNSNGNN